MKFYKVQWNIIENGGWHFSFLMKPEGIRDKLKSYAHAEFNTEKFTNLKNIEDRVKSNKDIFDRKQYYEKVDIDDSYPDYIRKNLNTLKDWIV